MDTPRRRGREAQSTARTAAARIPQAHWGSPRHATAPMALVSDADLERIHEASLTILEEIGMDFLSPQARAIALAAGAKAGPEPERLRFDRALVMAMVAKAPKSFVLRAGDPAKDLPIGQGFTHWGCVSSAPQVNDLIGGRRPGTQDDFRRFVKLGQSLNVIGFFGGYPVEPQDLPAIAALMPCRISASMISFSGLADSPPSSQPAECITISACPSLAPHSAKVVSYTACASGALDALPPDDR